jgi:pimeloyl-ACP methyl ester carboxylesterase
MAASKPEPFRLHVPDEALDDLRERLTRTRWPDEIPGSGWTYGSNREFMRGLVEHWRNGFDWRAQEAKINAFDQFRAEVGGIDLHYIHQPGVGPDPLPLLLVHGWPGSVWEFHDLIPRLTDPARFGGDPRDAFTVIAPSLPGYTLSFKPGQPRFDVVAMADLFAGLMTDVLGYPRFAVQGGDWGGYVVARLGAMHADRLLGIHLNFLPLRADIPFPAELSDEERIYRQELEHWQREETGYHAIQGTKPQTLAYGLTDSPAGLAGWILEKFRTWSDCGGDVYSRFSRDELLTNITIYWVTGTINAANRLYCETRRSGRFGAATEKVTVPTGAAIFPKELFRPPRVWAEAVYDIVQWTRMGSGGHFAAMEEPDALVGDIRSFFRGVR